ncbi:MAG: hypothetical protein JRJ85_17675 [Deltaproteobacteria bacterium]|nr:hypothetical protein [Deltaproteobacteria bacterium]
MTKPYPSAERIQLRDYQRNCLDAITGRYRAGIRRQLICLPTGTGIVDIVDVTREHSLTTLPGLFNLSPRFDLEGHTTDEVQKAIQWVVSHRPWVPIDRADSLSDLRYRCTKIDLFDLETPHEVAAYSDFAWVGFGKGCYRLGLTGGRAMVILPTILGRYEVKYRQNAIEKVISDKSELNSAIKEAERFVSKNYSDLLVLVKLNTRWRTKVLQKVRPVI